jgi:hypothetical protein
MTFKIASERDGFRNLKNELIQLAHRVVPLAIEYLPSDRSVIPITVRSMYGRAIKSIEKVSATSLFTPFSLERWPIDLRVDCLCILWSGGVEDLDGFVKFLC